MKNMSDEYVKLIEKLLQQRFGKNWRQYASMDQIRKHEQEGWDAEKFVDLLEMKFNLKPLS